jgi:peptide/nickel transport system substrate-binding protein
MSADERRDGTIIARRRFVQIAAATVAGAVLAACGGSNPAPTATTAAKPTTAAPTTGVTSASPVAAATGVPTAVVATAAALPTPALFKNPPPGKPQGNQPSELVLVWGTNQLTTHGIDPQTHGGTIAESQLRHIYEPLVKIERDATTISPALATSWKRLDDNTMQFTLRQGVQFHNGEEFDATAAQFSIMRPLDPKNNAELRTLYNVIDRVDIADKYTINVHTVKPDPVLLTRLSAFSGAMVAPKWAAANGQGGVLKDANGTGPYKLKSWGPNQDLVVEANDHYWGTAPPIKNVRMKTIAEQATRVAALRSGEIHVAKDIPPEEVDGINKSGRQTARAVSSNRFPYYVMEVRKPPLDNPKLRQAINYAVDWDGIIQGVLIGNGTRMATVLDPWHVGYDPTLKPYPYDPDKAKSLMTEAGFPNGFDVNIWYIQGRYMKDKEVAEAIAQGLN